MSEQVSVILVEGGLRVTRNSADAHIKNNASCEHRLNHEGGFGNKLSAVRKAVAAVTGVSHAYTSPRLDGGTVFYGLTNDEPGQYLPVANRVVEAARAVL